MMSKIEELLKDRGLLESMGITCDISVNEIKKGKVNHIFKLTDINKNLSYILKKSAFIKYKLSRIINLKIMLKTIV